MQNDIADIIEGGLIERNVLLKINGKVQKCPNCNMCNVFGKYSENLYECNACESLIETE